MMLVLGGISIQPLSAQECYEMAWCTDDESSAGFNNVGAGTIGQMFEPSGMDQPFLLCGFRMWVGEGEGQIGSIDCTANGCRAVAYRVFEDDSVIELASVALTGEVSGETDFIFDDPVYVDPTERYAVIIETQDEAWGLWQCCNDGENCCPDSRPVRIVDGNAIYNDPSYDDYAFLLFYREACYEMAWCAEDEPSAAFNNMGAGTIGQMFEPSGMDQPFLLCGFRMWVGEGEGQIGSIDCTGNGCRAVAYRVFEDDSVVELTSLALTGEVSGETDLIFDSPVYVDPTERYAVVIETQDEEWGLWQCCNEGEDCCPDSRPVHIVDGYADYNDPSFDDYAFLLWVVEDFITNVEVVEPSPLPSLAILPNPTTGPTKIEFSLQRAGDVTLDVYDVTGKLVRRIHRGLLANGGHSFSWDWRDDTGRPAAPGVYFTRLEAFGLSRLGRVVLIR